MKPEDIKGLNDHDYDIYNEWKIANKQATIKSIMQEIANKQATIKSIMQENKLLDARIMTEYKKMIINFTTLHAARSQAPIYFTIKNDLKNILLTGKPPEILPQLEPLQSILMP